MDTITREKFERILRVREATRASAAGSFIDRGDVVDVDVSHPAFPRPRHEQRRTPSLLDMVLSNPTIDRDRTLRRRTICLGCQHVNDVHELHAHCRMKGGRTECPRSRVAWHTSPDLACPLGKWAAKPADRVDLVYTWVDGSDPEWRSRYRQHVGQAPHATRCTDSGEFAASLRSVALYAPWINRIWIVSDGQTPADLPVNAQVIDHRDILPAERLPVFSSHAIEPHLHKIDGLAEHFLYANDDMLFGAAVEPGQFFAPDGTALVGMGDDARAGDAGMWNAACRNAADLLDTIFSPRPWRKGWHHIKPVRKSMLAEIAQRCPQAVGAATSRRVRSAQDIAWDAALWPGYGIATGYSREAPHGSITAQYIGMGTNAQAAEIDAARTRRPHLLCVNNGDPATANALRHFLATYSAESATVPA